jgi:hypothetical protein
MLLITFHFCRKFTLGQIPYDILFKPDIIANLHCSNFVYLQLTFQLASN